MTSDRTKEPVSAEKAEKKKTRSTNTILLDVDGKLNVGQLQLPLPEQQSKPELPASNTELSSISLTAELRQIIRLQRKALSDQELRIRRQRSLIEQLSKTILNLKHPSPTMQPKLESLWHRLKSKGKNQKQGQKQGKGSSVAKERLKTPS